MSKCPEREKCLKYVEMTLKKILYLFMGLKISFGKEHAR